MILDAQLASLFMEVKDITSSMVEASVNSEELSEDLNQNIVNIGKKLLENMPGNETEAQSLLSENEVLPTDIVEDSFTNDDLWHISLRFSDDFFNSGMDIVAIFIFFRKLGEILLNIPVIDKVPLISDLEPHATYIGFEMDFQSDCSYDEIIEIFEFVEDDVDLIVFKHDDKKSLQQMLLAREDNLKEILVQNCSYEETFFEDKQDIKKEEVIEEKTQAVPAVKKDEPKKAEAKKAVSKENQSTFTLRVDSLKVDLLINKMSELVIQNAKIMDIAESRGDDDLEEISDTFSLLLEEVRDAVMDIRMVQVKDSFVKFRRIVNDTAKKLGKDIEFIIEGGETELDKSVVEKLSDPLVHMLRNSIDHGVEMPDVRTSNGKNAKGSVYLRAYPDAGTIVIEIEDDGAGINKDAVLKKAISNGVVNESDNLSDKEIYKLIFSAGLSTAQEVSNISGRGVGMDVVRKNIEQLRGTIDVDSSIGKGSKITIRLPLTLAIIDGFLVQVGNTKYIIPLDMISECIELTDEYKSGIKGANTINVRGDVIPLLDIRGFYDEESCEEQVRKNAIIVRYVNEMIALQVDELYGEQQTVIKPLGDIFEKVPGISGSSILGSGEVALILDIPKLIEYQIKQGV
ncbi:MAG: chemotaxis protein CheA [Campylobacterota bacterium]|nr:chemotaxis protein CheA [Campylobacterota bacterium]